MKGFSLFADRAARLLWPLFSLCGFVLLWGVAAAMAQDRRLPSPFKVWEALAHEAGTGALWIHLSATLLRVAASFFVALAIGSAIGIALGRSERLNRWFGGWLILFLNMPALVTIALCYVWLGLGEAAAVTAVAINKIPNVAATLREGARALDRDLSEMADLYYPSALMRLRHVILPQLAPFFAAAARSGLALVWKIVLVVELLGRSNGVGFKIHYHFQNFEVDYILAYAFAFIVVVQIIEMTILEPWERRAGRWRR